MRRRDSSFSVVLTSKELLAQLAWASREEGVFFRSWSESLGGGPCRLSHVEPERKVSQGWKVAVLDAKKVHLHACLHGA